MSRRARWLTRWILLGTLATASGLDAVAQSPTEFERRDTAAAALRDISGPHELVVRTAPAAA